VHAADLAGGQGLAVAAAALTQLRVEAVEGLRVQPTHGQVPERGNDASVDLEAVVLQGSGGDLLDALAPLQPALQQIRQGARRGRSMSTLGHLRLQLRLKALGLTLRGCAAVLPALVSGQRVAAGVDLDLPVVSAVADHVLVLLGIRTS
jgi:hypothetical protein